MKQKVTVKLRSCEFNYGATVADNTEYLDALAIGDTVVFFIPKWSVTWTQAQLAIVEAGFPGCRRVKVQATVHYELTGKYYDPADYKSKGSK